MNDKNKLFYFSIVILACLIVYFYIEKNNPEFLNHNNWKNEAIPQELPQENPNDSEIPPEIKPETKPETNPEVKPEVKPEEIKPITPEPRSNSRKHRLRF